MRVLLVDDHPLVREGVRALLALDRRFEVVGDASDVATALDLLVRRAPDVVLLDAALGGACGFALIHDARARALPMGFLVLTTFDDDATFAAALRAGARGFLLKDVALEDLARAVLAVARGETAFRPAVTTRGPRRPGRV